MAKKSSKAKNMTTTTTTTASRAPLASLSIPSRDSLLWDPRAEMPLDPALVASVRAHGVLTPIAILDGGLVVDGRQRYRAAMEVGIDTVPVVVVERADALDATARNLTSDEPVATRIDRLTHAVEAILDGKKDKKSVAAARAKVATAEGVSSNMLGQILGLSRLIPEARASLDAGGITLATAIALSRLTEEEQREQLADGPKAKKKDKSDDKTEKAPSAKANAARLYQALTHRIESTRRPGAALVAMRDALAYALSGDAALTADHVTESGRTMMADVLEGYERATTGTSQGEGE